MLIDWFTVIAQMLNFLILIGLLKRFLYRPILKAIDTREQNIADKIAKADLKMTQAMQLHTEFEQKNTEFDQLRAERMAAMKAETEQEKTRLQKLTRQEADAMRKDLQQEQQKEWHDLQDALSQSTKHEVFALARKLLKDLADSSLEVQMTLKFIQRLNTLETAEMTQVRSAFSQSKQPLKVYSAFDLPQQQQHLIKDALLTLLARECELQFVTDSQLISGIELKGEGQKISWNIDAYLIALMQQLKPLSPVNESAP